MGFKGDFFSGIRYIYIIPKAIMIDGKIYEAYSLVSETRTNLAHFLHCYLIVSWRKLPVPLDKKKENRALKTGREQ